MILYEQDFLDQGAIVDTKTRNLSFLKLYDVYDRMGIKNRKFFLSLYHKELSGLDIHNLKDSSQELRLIIAEETKINYWFFIRELVMVVDQGGDPVHFIASRANIATSWVTLNCVNAFLTMPRQLGKTIIAITLPAWFIYFAARNLNFGMFAKDNDLVLDNVARFKDIKNSLPSFLIHQTRSDEDNKEGVSYASFNNIYKTYNAQPNLRSAKKQGRGQSLAAYTIDEPAYYVNIEHSYGSINAATSAATEQVQRRGIPIANTLTTTAGHLLDPSGAFANSIRLDALPFTELHYDFKNRDEFRTVVNRHSQQNMVYLEFSFFQLGKNEDWFRVRAATKTSREEIEMDLLNIWQTGTSASIITQEQRTKLHGSKRDPLGLMLKDDICINWYKSPEIYMSPEFRSRKFIIGGDTSDNVGIDSTTIIVMDPETLETVASCCCNERNLILMAECIVYLMTFLENSVFIPERNKNGVNFIDYVLLRLKAMGVNPFYRVYNTVVQNLSAENSYLLNTDPSNNLLRSKFGWTTTSAKDSRPLLYKQVLSLALTRASEVTYDRTLVDQILTLIFKNNRVDHRNGYHDDMVVAWLLTMWLLFYGKNLHIYGIDIEQVAASYGTEGHSVDVGYKQSQHQIIERINKLEKMLESQIDRQDLKMTIGRELRTLQRLVDPTMVENKPVIADQLQQSAQPTNKVSDLNLLKILTYS